MLTASLTVLASHKAAILLSSHWKCLAALVAFTCICHRRTTPWTSETGSDIHSSNRGKKQAGKLALFPWLAAANQERQRQKDERNKVQRQWQMFVLPVGRTIAALWGLTHLRQPKRAAPAVSSMGCLLCPWCPLLPDFPSPSRDVVTVTPRDQAWDAMITMRRLQSAEVSEPKSLKGRYHHGNTCSLHTWRAGR